eukprot:GHVU01077406.1.p1 GENE.GHVU01077406.1~~GHVU01077406.1.p1  ORF type:complete len:159 (-),score=0.13 GHVU01077406.1:165-641(-)
MIHSPGCRYLFVDPRLLARLVHAEFLRLEPEGNFPLRGLRGVAAVDHVAADVDAKVATDGPGSALLGVGLPDEAAALLHDVRALPHHSNYWAAAHVLHQPRKKRFRLELRVVLQKGINIGASRGPASDTHARTQESSSQCIVELHRHNPSSTREGRTE